MTCIALHRNAIAFLLGGFCLGHALVVAAEARRLSEEELKATEPVNPPKEGLRRAPFSTQITRQPTLAYFDYFDSKFADIKAQVDAQRDAAADDVAKPPPANASTENAALRAASDAAFAGSMIASDLKGGMVRGMPANTASNVLTGVAIAFDILEWLSRDTTDRDVRYQSLKAMRNPSLYLYKFVQDVKGDDDFYLELVKSQRQIEALGIECEPAYFHAQSISTRGYGIAEWLRTRRLVCGYRDGDELGLFARVREPRDLTVFAPTDRPTLVYFRLTRLDDMERMPALLGLEKDDMALAGRVLYERIASKIDASWTVIFMAPTTNGEWHAFAAREGYVVEFPQVPER